MSTQSLLEGLMLRCPSSGGRRCLVIQTLDLGSIVLWAIPLRFWIQPLWSKVERDSCRVSERVLHYLLLEPIPRNLLPILVWLVNTGILEWLVPGRAISLLPALCSPLGESD